MIYFLRGKVAHIDGDTIIIDVRDVGYQVLVSHIEDYALNEEVYIYTHEVVREDDQYLVGFKSLEEKTVFLSLIKVKGLGPKSAITALSATTPQQVINAIASNNVAYLKLKGELTGSKGDPGVYEEVYEALKELGFKGAAIDRVLATINEPNAAPEDILRMALAKLRTK